MPEDLTTLPPEEFLRLAVERGGLDLDQVSERLSPQAAKALRFIAATPSTLLPDDAMRSKATRDLIPEPARGAHQPLPGPRCRVCGRTNLPGDRFCRKCGRQLAQAAPALTLEDLVAQGGLTPEQAQELRETLLFHQSHYTAGTRYSVFGANR